MIATSVNTGEDRAGQFYREMTTKGSRIVKRQHKVCGNDPAKPSCCEVPQNVAKVNSLQACRGYIVKNCLEVPEATRGGIS